MAKAKRNKKKGYVYLLLSDIGVFKFGCTTLSPSERCKVINRRYKEYGKFSVIGAAKSKDVYMEEKLVKWEFWAHGHVGEFLYDPDHDAIKQSFFGVFNK